MSEKKSLNQESWTVLRCWIDGCSRVLVFYSYRALLYYVYIKVSIRHKWCFKVLIVRIMRNQWKLWSLTEIIHPSACCPRQQLNRLEKITGKSKWFPTSQLLPATVEETPHIDTFLKSREGKSRKRLERLLQTVMGNTWDRKEREETIQMTGRFLGKQ